MHNLISSSFLNSRTFGNKRLPSRLLGEQQVPSSFSLFPTARNHDASGRPLSSGWQPPFLPIWLFFLQGFWSIHMPSFPQRRLPIQTPSRFQTRQDHSDRRHICRLIQLRYSIWAHSLLLKTHSLLYVAASSKSRMQAYNRRVPPILLCGSPILRFSTLNWSRPVS